MNRMALALALISVAALACGDSGTGGGGGGTAGSAPGGGDPAGGSDPAGGGGSGTEIPTCEELAEVPGVDVSAKAWPDRAMSTTVVASHGTFGCVRVRIMPRL